MQAYSTENNVSYIVTFLKQTGQVTITYKDSLLKSIAYDVTLEPNQLEYMQKHIPVTVSLFLSVVKTWKFARYKLAPADLSFEAFWKRYNNKVGNKPRAKKLWDMISDEERTQAIVYLDKYDYFMSTHPNLTKLYPETYLSQKRYLND